MTEDFLHYIWRYALFNTDHLITHDNLPLTLVSNGEINFGAGPDFSNAQICIEHITWVGNIEIHKKSSDWFRHGHETDPIYLNCILHVVWQYDQPVYDGYGNEIPTLVLQGRVSKLLLDTYQSLRVSTNKIMCAGFFSKLNDFKTFQWLNRVMVERLERKVNDLAKLHTENTQDWEQLFFLSLLQNFGFKTNALPMMLLARSIDFKILLKNKDQLSVLEAILFGVSGLLDAALSKDDYVSKLQKEYHHQKTKYGLDTLSPEIWHFGRIRPSNFPTLRIAQLAMLIHLNGNLFDRFIRNFSKNEVKKGLAVFASRYWDNRYVFDQEGETKKVKKVGGNAMDNILINTISPLLFFYGKEVDSKLHQEQALKILENIPAENNGIVRNWKEKGFVVKTAADSQSLIELTNLYCASKNCLNCGIGNQVLGK